MVATGRGKRQFWLVACLLVASSGGAGAETPTGGRVSIVQVPIELDLGPLFAAAEAALPTRAGDWPRWGRWHGIDTRYRAWRGPLWLTMQGETLSVQAHVRYQLQARKELFGDLGFTAGCGVKEPPRQALIGMLARLEWGPDWSIRPRFRAVPTRFLDRCEVTVADIDVSPIVGRVFEDRMEASLREAMRAVEPRLERLRGAAAHAWQAMQTPRELTPGLWLHVRPEAIALAPFRGAGARVETAVWLAFRARVSLDDRRDGETTPLPPLMAYRPAQPGLRFTLGLELDYPLVSAALSERLRGETLEIEGRQVTLQGVTLRAQEQELVLTVDLTGDITGHLSIMARPGFDPAEQVLRLEQVDFEFDPADPHQGLLVDLFYERIRRRIEAAANALLAERTKGLHLALASTLAQGLPAELQPDLSDVRLAELHVRPSDAGLALSGVATGSLRFGARTSAKRP